MLISKKFFNFGSNKTNIMRTIILTVKDSIDFKSLVGRLIDAKFLNLETSYNDLIGFIVRIKSVEDPYQSLEQIAHELGADFCEIK